MTHRPHYPLSKEGIREALDTGQPGVYRIFFASFRNMSYIGSGSVCLRRRLMDHRNKLSKGIHKNRHLHGLYKRFPNECRFEIVQLTETGDEAKMLEQLILDFTPKKELFNQDNQVFGIKRKKR